jgi:hypothetical protein
VVVVGVAVVAGREYDSPDRLPPGLKDYALVRAATDRIADALRGSRGVLIDVPIEVRNSLTFQSAIAYSLRREGLALAVPPRLSKEMGGQYQPAAGGFEYVLAIRDAGARPTADSRLLVSNDAVTIWATRAR